MLKENEFTRLFPTGTKLPMIDAIRDTLKVIDLNRLEVLWTKAMVLSVKEKAVKTVR